MITLIAFGVIVSGVCLPFSYLEPPGALLCVALYLYCLGRCASVPCRHRGSHGDSLSGRPDLDLVIAAAWPLTWPCLLLYRAYRYAATILPPPDSDSDSPEEQERLHERTPSQW
jgi:hypothetical protein